MASDHSDMHTNFMHVRQKNSSQECPICRIVVNSMYSHRQKFHPPNPKNISFWHCGQKFLTTTEYNRHLKR